jgi:parallel beta-helix repeat protein
MQRELKFMMVVTGLLLAFTMVNAVGAASYTITDDSYGTYFNESGYIKDSNIHAGDVLDLYGTINNKNMYIDRPLNLTSTSKTGKLVNGTITILKNGSGSNVTGLTIQNSNENGSGISLYETENNTIRGNSISCNGPYGFGIPLTRSNHNKIIENTVKTYKYTIDGNTRTHTAIPLGSSNYNIIAGNHVESNGADCIYLTIYSSGKFESDGASYYNSIFNNTCVGVNDSFCYAIQVMGSYNNVTNNTVTGSYRGVSSEMDTEGGNAIVGNTICATYCGIYFTSKCTVSGNKISGYDSTDSGIRAYGSGAIIKDNIINLASGYGIYLAGSNCTVTGNNITTSGTKEGIYVYGKIDNNTLSENVITSNSTGILLKKQSSSKFPTNTKINSNHITTTGTYAVDSTEGSSTTVTNNLLVSSGNQGNDAVNTGSNDTVADNYGKLTPSADVGSGSFNKGITVHLTAVDNKDPNPRIYYTTNGSTPTTGSTLYTGSISVSKEGATVLKFIAVNLDGEVSDVVTKTYIIDTKVPTASVNVSGGTYNVSKSVTLKMSENGTIYYTTNGVTPTTGSTKYSGSFSVGSTCTLKFLAADKAGNKSPVYTVKYVIDKTAPKASASVSSGYYNVAKSVTLKMSESGSIYYTLNGAAPTTRSVRYTKPITISSTCTLRFLAVDKAGNKSPVYTVKYVIDKAAPKVSLTSPKNKAGKVSRTGTIGVKFSESVKAGVNWSKVYIKNLKTGKKVAVSKVIKGNILYLKTTSKRSANTWYQVYIPAYAVKDTAGNKMAKAYTFKFKTGK